MELFFKLREGKESSEQSRVAGSPWWPAWSLFQFVYIWWCSFWKEYVLCLNFYGSYDTVIFGCECCAVLKQYKMENEVICRILSWQLQSTIFFVLLVVSVNCLWWWNPMPFFQESWSIKLNWPNLVSSNIGFSFFYKVTALYN